MRKWGKVLLALLLLAAVLVGCGQNVQAAWQEQYDLGMRLLSEQNYEEAILAFREAIRIDPKREEAYIGLADVYLAQGDAAAALAAVEEGIAQCGESENLTAKRDEAQVAEEEEEPQATPEPTATPEPEREKYPLTAEQQAANLTGQDPFWVEDLGEGVFYAPGTTLADVAASGLELDIDVEEWMAEKAPFIGRGDPLKLDVVRGEDPWIYVHSISENQDLAKVEVLQDWEIEGPRGVTLGTSLEEVLERFYCTNAEVLKDPVKAFEELEGQYRSGNNTQILLYQISDSDWAKIITEFGLAEPRVIYHTEAATLNFYFQGRKVIRYDVTYNIFDD